MLLELRRSGGFTGTRKQWRIDTDAEESWQSLVDAAELDRYRGTGPILRRLVLGSMGGGHHDDHQYELRVDGRRARFSGAHLEGALSDLVDRIVAEGEEMGSRPEPSNG